MSQNYCYVCPYAEWHLTEEEDTMTDELYSYLLENASGVGLTFHDNPPTITIEGKDYIQKLWTPFYCSDAKEQPPRQFVWDSCGTEAVDLQGIDPRAEIEWFQETFKAQLDALSGHYGKRPQIHWGVVASRG